IRIKHGRIGKDARNEMRSGYRIEDASASRNAIAVKLEVLKGAAWPITHGRIEPLSLTQRVFQHLHLLDSLQRRLCRIIQQCRLLVEHTLQVIRVLSEQIEQPGTETGRGLVARHQENVRVSKKLLIAQSATGIIASLHEHAQHIVRWMLTSLLNLWKQQLVQMSLELSKTPLIIVCIDGYYAKIENLDKDVAELIHFRTRMQARESLGGDIKSDLTRLFVDIHHTTRCPIGGTFANNAVHDGKVMVHVADGKGRVHHATMLVVLSSIHRQQAISKHLD